MSINYACNSILMTRVKEISQKVFSKFQLSPIPLTFIRQDFHRIFPRFAIATTQLQIKLVVITRIVQNQSQISDENQMDFKSHPFTFQDKMDHKTEATKKKFVFDDNTQTCKPGEFKNVLAAMDEYIDFLNESSDSFTINTESTSKFELQLFQKLNMIRQKHEGLFQKYKEAQHNYKSQKYQNQLLRQKLSDLHKQFEEEHNDKLRLASSHTKLKSKYKDLLMRSQYLQNSFLKERLKNENHKLFIGRLQQDSPENLETQSQQLTHETHETEEENYVTKFLKSQMRKLKQNNQQIDQYSRVFSKKYSENNNNTTHEEF